jgi:conjugal transfer pilus assembly protein TraW
VNYKAVLITLIALFAFADTSWGIVKYLGTTGATYSVVEPDILAELKQRAVQADRSIDKKKLRNQMKRYQPASLYKLPRASANRSKMVDMTYTLDRDLVDGDNKVIYPKGYTYNPLDYITVPGGLVVIDGDDPEQVKWFKKSPYFENHQARLLISDGYVFELIEKLQRPVFYLTNDIAERLQLSAVPSLIFQQGNKMQVQEFKIDKKNEK